MNTMLDARMVAASTHRAVDDPQGDVHGAARMNAASEGDDGNAVIGWSTQPARIDGFTIVQEA
jgi:hypothetical protein